MTAENNKTIDEDQIRRMIEQRVEAVRANDIDVLMSHHAPDILSFDVLNPLQSAGADTIKERAAKWLSSYQTAIGYEVRDLGITTDGRLGFCHYLYRVSGTLKGGGNVDMWVRATVCLRKVEGKWMIRHEHQSVPFDAETGKASLDLKP